VTTSWTTVLLDAMPAVSLAAMVIAPPAATLPWAAPVKVISARAAEETLFEARMSPPAAPEAP